MNSWKNEGPILLIDGMGLIHRAKVGNLDGEFVLIYNFFRSFRYLVDSFSPSQIFFVLEGDPKARKALYPEYKKNRIIKTAEDQSKKDLFLNKAQEIIKLLQFLPVTLVRHPDHEADDVIGSLVDNLTNENVVIISGDSDLIQLLQRGHVKLKLYHPIKKEYISAPKYNYLAYKCLAGDKKSDNIAGIVSQSKALKLIEDPDKLSKFFDIKENVSLFNLNKAVIELTYPNLLEAEFIKPTINFSFLKSEFKRMEFETIINDKSWDIFKNTFAGIDF